MIHAGSVEITPLRWQQLRPPLDEDMVQPGAVPDVLYALSLEPGTENEYRALGEFARANRDSFGASRRRFGIRRHASWLAVVDGQPWSLVLLQAEDPDETSARSLRSDDPFDIDWRERARSLFGEQVGAVDFGLERLVDAGSEQRDVVTEFLAGARVANGEALPSDVDLEALGLERLLVVRQGPLLLTYASGDVSGAFERARGGDAEPLLASLYELPIPEPIIAWSGA